MGAGKDAVVGAERAELLDMVGSTSTEISPFRFSVTVQA